MDMATLKQTVPISSAPKRISKIQFGTLKRGDIQKCAEIEVCSRELFQMPSRAPAAYGCMDPRLGISDKRGLCQTCNKKLIDCAGHFGYIPLELPVFHAGYFKHTLTILQCICKQCSRILLPLNERAYFLKKLQNPAFAVDAFNRGNIFKRIVALCKRNTVCPYCNYSNGVVKKLSGCVFKIIHEKFRAKNVVFNSASGVNESAAKSASAELQQQKQGGGGVMELDAEDLAYYAEQGISAPAVISSSSAGSGSGSSATSQPTASLALQKQQLREITTAYPDLKPYLTKSQEVISAVKCYELMQRITQEDIVLLWMDNEFGNTPDTLILWNIPVPPVPIRPSVPMDSGDGSTEDDITMKIQEIIDVNNALRMALNNGGTMKMVVEDWDFLQIQCAQMINGETPGIPRTLLGPKPIRGICQRLKGKQGRFRGNLSGKRVDFSARTVISPDPNLRVEQVGVPVAVAVIMTYPEKVNRYNIEKLRQCVRNGPKCHPGANMVRSASGFVKSLAYADREVCAKYLAIGDIVERHMQDGDVVLFNRQPSLHKMSIMAHVAKVMPWCTFRFNECSCTPYNADFDGDEMNMHLPQTEEARAEAFELMMVTNNLVTPRNGEPLVAATQDFLTAAYLLTQKDVFLSKSEFCRLVSFLSDAQEEVHIPPPAILKPVALWTGKQVISIMVNPNKSSKSLVNVECPEKFYTAGEHFCSQDGYAAFHHGELISGNLGKKTLGDSSKKGLFFVLIRDYGPKEATRCMSRLAKLASRYLCDRGFSIGIEDVAPTDGMTAVKTRILTEGQREAKQLIEQYKCGKIKLKPGCDALQSLESEVNGILGRIREKCGQEAMGTLHHRNAPLSMAQCGSKGSPLNISQMISCLGQQSVGGHRIQDGFINRTLPHFAIGSLLPDAKGFVANSFYSGLTATEFFFHTMGGREGLVDTAVKTAETGYMARRLMKALEDLSLAYDRTVRNSEQMVVQFSYGDDGLNPSVMENGDRPVDYRRLSVNICKTYPCNGEPALSASEIRALARNHVNGPVFRALLPQGQQFLDETGVFFNSFADRLEELEMLEVGWTSPEEASLASSAAPAIGSAISLTGNQIRAKLAAMSPQDLAKWKQDGAKVVAIRCGIAGNKNKNGDSFKNAAEEERCLTAYHEMHTLLRENTMRLTLTQMQRVLEAALRKYGDSYIEPGEAIGAVGAQSLSEPGTQMTLKTFHFAGVASMNVTLGVPRLKEIINASKIISTPIIEAKIVQSNSVTSARIVKARIEKTSLGELCEYICEVYSGSEAYIAVKLDMDCIAALHLSVDAHAVRHAILTGSSANVITGTGAGGVASSSGGGGVLPKSTILRALKAKHIVAYGKRRDKLKIYAPEMKESGSKTSAAARDAAGDGDGDGVDGAGGVGGGGSGSSTGASSGSKSYGIPAAQRIYFALQALKAVLPSIIVQGIPSVSRAVINEAEGSGSAVNGGQKNYYLLVEGYGLASVMGCPGIDGRETKSNHVLEMQSVLGIEASRGAISDEIRYIMKAYGITVDRRHLLLLSDVMTFKGEVLGITRFGVAKMRESVLMLASFEKTTDHLFDAAVHYRTDTIVGVSECIIMGIPIPIGTGLFKLMMKDNIVDAKSDSGKAKSLTNGEESVTEDSSGGRSASNPARGESGAIVSLPPPAVAASAKLKRQQICSSLRRTRILDMV